jgi:hypothetical protein
MNRSMNRKEMAEEVRLRALYRRLAIKGGASFDRLPISALIGLVGPDCAYHLYSIVPSGTRAGKKPVKRGSHGK